MDNQSALGVSWPRSTGALLPSNHKSSRLLTRVTAVRLEDFLGRQPQQKLRFSRRTMCALGEYTEAMEMRELLLDAHRPWLDMAKAE